MAHIPRSTKYGIEIQPGQEVIVTFVRGVDIPVNAGPIFAPVLIVDEAPGVIFHYNQREMYYTLRDRHGNPIVRAINHGIEPTTFSVMLSYGIAGDISLIQDGQACQEVN